jgi:site-specific DNA-cytosine methylase
MTTIGSLFSGGGGWDAGAQMVGITPVFAVEMDPELAKWHHRVFGGLTLAQSVATVNWSAVRATVGRLDVLVSSPPCQDYSPSGRMQAALAEKRGTDRGDRSYCDPFAGLHTLDAVDALNPRVVLLEEVTSYADSEVFKLIVEGLKARGFTVDYRKLELDKYGLPSSRRRLFMRAVRGVLPPWPAPSPRTMTWHDAIFDLIPSLPLRPLSPSQAHDLGVWGMPTTKDRSRLLVPPSTPLLISGGNRGEKKIGGVKVRYGHLDATKPGWTMQKAKGITGMRVVDDRGFSRIASPRVAARLAGFPDSYPIEELLRTPAFNIIGNSVPPLMAAQLLAPFAPARANPRVAG